MPAFLFAILFGVLVFSPQLISAHRMGDSFQGVYREMNDDQNYYLARARDVADGYGSIGNAYLFEHKNDTPLPLWLPDYLLAKPLAFFHINVVHGYMLYDFLFPPIIFLLTYGISYLLTRSRLISALSAITLCFGIFFLEFGRTPSPQLNFITWLVFFFFLIQYIQSSEKLSLYGAGLFLGLQFYFYPYYWSYSVILLILLMLAFFFRSRNVSISFLKIFGIGLFIALPYGWLQFQAMVSPHYLETLLRHGLIYSHFPSGLASVFISLILLAGSYYAIRKNLISFDGSHLILIGAVSSAIIVVNQHVITGKNLEFSSHYWLISVFSFFFLGIFLLNSWMEQSGNRKKILAGLTLAVAAVSIGNISAVMKSQIAFTDTDISRQRYAPMFDWLNANAPKDSVVYANNDISELIPVYTNQNVFYNHYANLFLMSDNEIWARFAIAHFFDPITKEFVMRQDHRRDIWGLHLIDEYAHNQSKNRLRKLIGLPSAFYEEVPQSAVLSFMEFANGIKQNDFKKELATYRTDYVVWDKKMDPGWDISKELSGNRIFEEDDIAVYAIRSGAR